MIRDATAIARIPYNINDNFEMADKRRRRRTRRPKKVPRAAADFVRQLKISYLENFVMFCFINNCNIQQTS